MKILNISNRSYILFICIIIFLECFWIYSDDDYFKVAFKEVSNLSGFFDYSNDFNLDNIIYFEPYRNRIFALPHNDNTPLLKPIANLSDLTKNVQATFIDNVISQRINSGVINGPWAVIYNEKSNKTNEKIYKFLSIKYDKNKDKIINEKIIQTTSKPIYQLCQANDNTICYISGPERYSTVYKAIKSHYLPQTYDLISTSINNGKQTLISKKVESLFDVNFFSGKLYVILDGQLAEIDLVSTEIKKLCKIKLNSDNPLPVFCYVFYFEKDKSLIICDLQGTKKSIYKYDLKNGELSFLMNDWYGYYKIDNYGVLGINQKNDNRSIINADGKIITEWPEDDNKQIIGCIKKDTNEFVIYYVKKQG